MLINNNMVIFRKSRTRFFDEKKCGSDKDIENKVLEICPFRIKFKRKKALGQLDSGSSHKITFVEVDLWMSRPQEPVTHISHTF